MDMNGREKTVLVVDDEEAWRILLGRMLQRAGYRVVLATDGVDALTKIENIHPVAVLLDLFMPKMGGQQVLEVIRRLYPVLPVVVVSANRESSRGLDALGAGAKDYVTKPVDMDYLLQTLAVVV